MPHLLSIDLGTSSVKVLLATETGQILSQSSAEYPTSRPQPDWAEQNPSDWWQAIITAMGQLLNGMKSQSQSLSIAAIGLSAQMHGTVLLNKQGQLLGPAIIWPDQRSHRQVHEITDLIGAEQLVTLTGSPVATGFQAATLRWLQQEQPDQWQKVHTILLPKDYLRWRLTGNFHTDPSDGSGSLLLDVRTRDWSTEILTALEIEPARLPPVIASDAVAGQLSPQAAEELGLTAGIPVVTGAGDTPCGALGAGIVDAHSLLLTISTGGQLILPATEVQVDPQGRIHTFCGALAPGPTQPGWYQMAATLSAGMSLRWLREQVLDPSGTISYSQMTTWAEAAPPGANGLLYLPYLTGERTPHMNPQARSMLLGLTARHGRAELSRAVMEGVALGCYDAYSVLAEIGAKPERVILAGGGGRSQLWQTIIADIFGLPVQRLGVTEQSALGALLLAGAGIGLFDLVPTAQSWASYDSPVEPNHERHSFYRAQLLPLFRSAYQKNRELFGQLQTLENAGSRLSPKSEI